MDDFVAWLKGQLVERSWKSVDLAREGGITTAQISRIMTREQAPGPQACRTIALALGLPAHEVFIRAGLLPPESGRDWLIDRFVETLKDLPKDDQEELFELARVKAERVRRAKQKKSHGA